VSKVIVDKAELILKTNSSEEGGGAINVKTHKITSPWVVMQVGWDNSSNTTSWAFSGGDFSSNTITPNAASYNFAPDTTMTISLDPAVVQDWMMNPSTNYGMLMKVGNESIENYSEIYSSGAVEPSDRPMLKIWYYTVE
jgi:predicted outer membrane repeat protein